MANTVKNPTGIKSVDQVIDSFLAIFLQQFLVLVPMQQILILMPLYEVNVPPGVEIVFKGLY